MPDSGDKHGSIPAHAGEPTTYLRRRLYPAVYPRPRGGTVTEMSAAELETGLSPPTRGNRRCLCRLPSLLRSIPAHAGEPVAARCDHNLIAVYPRPRGGTEALSGTPYLVPGLSPPTRGNRDQIERADIANRSIPAHAGEPQLQELAEARCRVYPRPRGGTEVSRDSGRTGTGLSPPTRGNPVSASLSVLGTWSIPAHAGEPRRRVAGAASCPVYPRPRGGTTMRPIVSTSTTGLSPPTRGNRDEPVLGGLRHRSIPAHAGEPIVSTGTRGTTAVYPRPRGGTADIPGKDRPYEGLSPPTRGNHRAGVQPSPGPGSIPAHAGEPRPDLHPPLLWRVYPRPRGGTQGATRRTGQMSGLSPPTRGNLWVRVSTEDQTGSIPAHAGEP